MTKSRALLWGVFLLCIILFLFIDKNHTKEYFLENYKEITSISQTNDDNFLIAGKTPNFGTFLAKVNRDGKILGEKRFGGFNDRNQLPLTTNDDIKVAITPKNDIVAAMHTE